MGPLHDALQLLGTLSSVFYGLVLLGGGFLLWSRARAAALTASGAGLSLLAAEVAFKVLDVVRRANPPGTSSARAVWRLVSMGLGFTCNLVFYVLLGAAVLLLARGARR
ncbi:MAG: hypothetical protein HY909_28355 [Deltaproteobacteria bacterium]|nr:hypothetical protein [Deltaproteobacteria bacterium]